MKFVYPNAKFEAIGNPFLTEKEVNHLLENKELGLFKEMLNTSKDYKVAGEDIISLQNSLEDQFIQTIEMMRRDSPKKLNAFYDTYLEKIDIIIIRNKMKTILLGTQKNIDIEKTNLPHTQELLRKLSNATKETLPQILESYGFEKDLIEAIVTEPLDLLAVDTALDKHAIKNLTQVKVPYKCEHAKQRFVHRMTDIMTIKQILRAKQLGYDSLTCKKLFLGVGAEIAQWRFQEMTETEQIADVISALDGTSYFPVLNDALRVYTTEGSIQVFENALDRYFLKIIRDVSLENYITLGPTLRFLVSKEFEIQNLKVIAKGISDQLPADFTKQFIIMEAG